MSLTLVTSPEVGIIHEVRLSTLATNTALPCHGVHNSKQAKHIAPSINYICMWSTCSSKQKRRGQSRIDLFPNSLLTFFFIFFNNKCVEAKSMLITERTSNVDTIKCFNFAHSLFCKKQTMYCTKNFEDNYYTCHCVCVKFWYPIIILSKKIIL